VLDTVVRNSTLTSLDFASNDFKISQKEYLNESIKTFLRDNTTVRQIDLSNNKYVLHASWSFIAGVCQSHSYCLSLDAKTTQAIQLGLLHNETMLIILLTGNVNALKSNGMLCSTCQRVS
jgi:hypothetical protein